MRLHSSALSLLLVLPGLVALPLGGGPEPPIKYVPIDGTAIAITFDACATLGQTYTFDRAVFETLKRERVPATIFVSGRWIEGHPDVMAELAADPLIEFGDHSYDHPHMIALPRPQMEQEVDETEAALARFGKKGVAFRPPYGEWNLEVLQMLERKRLPAVLWDVVSGDPSVNISAAGIVRNVLAKTRPGSIIVFHINGRGWKTAEAMPSVISGLRLRGFRFVPLSEMLTARPATVRAPLPPPVFDALVPAR
jgi:peptidoglycan/xylan/chitin deacetylase (PgdA/CDA1 family)